MLPDKQIKKIPLDEVMEFLGQEGLDVTKEEVELIMEFLYQLAEWTFQTYFRNQEYKPNNQTKN